MKMRGTKNNPSVSPLGNWRIKEGSTEVNITRRGFLGFFLLGGFVSLFAKKTEALIKPMPKKAMFWRELK